MWQQAAWEAAAGTRNGSGSDLPAVSESESFEPLFLSPCSIALDTMADEVEVEMIDEAVDGLSEEGVSSPPAEDSVDPGAVDIPPIRDETRGAEPIFPGQACLVLAFKGQSHEKTWRRANIEVVNEDGTCMRPEGSRARRARARARHGDVNLAPQQTM